MRSSTILLPALFAAVLALPVQAQTQEAMQKNPANGGAQLSPQALKQLQNNGGSSPAPAAQPKKPKPKPKPNKH